MNSLLPPPVSRPTLIFNFQGKKIEALDIEIGPGLYLKGKINFLGYTVAAEIIVNPPKKFLVDIQLSPIDWAGGLIAVRRSSTDKKNGPRAFIYLTTTSITVQIEGYISLLGMSTCVKIDVSDTAFKFHVVADLWGMLRAELYVEAAYGNLAVLSFQVCLILLIEHLKMSNFIFLFPANNVTYNV